MKIENSFIKNTIIVYKPNMQSNDKITKNYLSTIDNRRIKCVDPNVGFVDDNDNVIYSSEYLSNVGINLHETLHKLRTATNCLPKGLTSYCIAGGFALNALVPTYEADDVDVFTSTELRKKMITSEFLPTRTTSLIVEYSVRLNKKRTTIQLVHYVNDSVYNVLDNFDIDVVQIGYQNDILYSYTNSILGIMLNTANIYPGTRPMNNLCKLRFLKYKMKGFTMLCGDVVINENNINSLTTKTRIFTY